MENNKPSLLARLIGSILVVAAIISIIMYVIGMFSNGWLIAIILALFGIYFFNIENIADNMNEGIKSMGGIDRKKRK